MAKADTEKPKTKPRREAKPKLTDTERHRRFVDMAHEIGADENPEAFDRAFESIVMPKERPASRRQKRPVNETST